MEGKYTCATCGKGFAKIKIRLSKCPKCFKEWEERKKALQDEGYFSNMKRMGSWAVNGKRGRREY